MTLIKDILYLVHIFLDESISILLVFPEFIFTKTKTHMQKLQSLKVILCVYYEKRISGLGFLYYPFPPATCMHILSSQITIYL